MAESAFAPRWRDPASLVGLDQVGSRGCDGARGATGRPLCWPSCRVRSSLCGVLRCATLRPLLTAQDREVRLMSREYVRPFVNAQKTTDRDAEAIAEAAIRPTMLFVALESEAQLELQVLHRICDRLVGQRTSITTQRAASCSSAGGIFAQGRRTLLEALRAMEEHGEASILSGIWPSRASVDELARAGRRCRRQPNLQPRTRSRGLARAEPRESSR